MIKFQHDIKEYNLAFAAFHVEMSSRLNRLHSELLNTNNQANNMTSEIKKTKGDVLFVPLFKYFIHSLGLKITSSSNDKYDILRIDCSQSVNDEIVLFELNFYENTIHPL